MGLENYLVAVFASVASTLAIFLFWRENYWLFLVGNVKMEDILLFLFKINNLIKFFIIINSDLQSAPSAQTQVLIDKQSQKRKEMQFKVSFIY